MSRSMRLQLWLMVIFLSFGLVLLPCCHRVRNGGPLIYTSVNLKQIGLAIYNYAETRGGRMPPAVVRDMDGKPLYSWRVLLLPYLEHESLYRQFHLDEPWDSPHNLAFAQQTPLCYRTGFDVDLAPGTTRYQAYVGPGTAFERHGLTRDDFPDGQGNTIAVVEAATAVPWSKPVDLIYDPKGPLPALKDDYKDPIRFLCYEVSHRPGTVVCFVDGSVRFLPRGFDQNKLRAMITRNGGEAVSFPRE